VVSDVESVISNLGTHTGNKANPQPTHGASSSQ
jgi:hypothetical protein